MQIPQLDSLSTDRLSRVFNNTVATYKYYWLISILNIHMSTGAMRISIWDIVISMIANAWYMVSEYKLNLGPADTLESLVHYAYTISGLKSSEKKEVIIETIKGLDDKNYLI